MIESKVFAIDSQKLTSFSEITNLMFRIYDNLLFYRSVNLIVNSILLV
jgi:hypothetical protein